MGVVKGVRGRECLQRATATRINDGKSLRIVLVHRSSKEEEKWSSAKSICASPRSGPRRMVLETFEHLSSFHMPDQQQHRNVTSVTRLDVEDMASIRRYSPPSALR